MEEKINIRDYVFIEKESEDLIKEEIEKLKKESLFINTLEKVGIPIFILNNRRQLLFINEEGKKFFKVKKNDIYGLRPGEVFGCINSFITGKGCGTSEACVYCGFLNSAFNTFISKKESAIESDLNVMEGKTIKSTSIKIHSDYIEIHGIEYLLFTLIDNEAEQINKMMQKVFFHDLINITGSVKGLIEFLSESSRIEQKEFFDIVNEGFEQMIDLIESQRQLLNAENDELKISFSLINLNILIDSCIKLYKNNHIFIDKKIDIQFNNNKDSYINTDESILKRVIGNMIKNAIEASYQSEVIKLIIDETDEKIIIEIQNKREIPKDIKPRIFQKIVSSKGNGRGWGTYSIKLFTEKYLDGIAGFRSNMEEGTKFFIIIPKK